MTSPTCRICGKPYAEARAALGITTCMPCADAQPHKTRTIVPMHKSAYTLVTDYSLLRQLNKP